MAVVPPWLVKFKKSCCQAQGVNFSYYVTSTDILFEKLGWIDLQSQRKIAKGILVYKALNGLAPDYLTQMFTLRDTGDKLALPQARTNYLKDSFSYSGAVLWNSLPNEVRQANTLSQFKTYCSNFFR